MRDHTQLLAFELADEVAMVVYRVEPKVVETEKVLNGLIRALRDNSEPSAFSLQPKHLSSYQSRTWYLQPASSGTMG
jgi:hypothetical protein